MTRTGSIFAVGMMAIVPFGLVSLAVTTRFLAPADFGALAVYYTLASALTVLGGMGVLHGTLMSVYGVGDDEDGVDGADEIEVDDIVKLATPEATSAERRRLLGSGLLAVFATSGVLCGGVAALGAFVVAPLFIPSAAGPLAATAASAWSGAVWRLVTQVPRMERKAGRWASLQFVRPAAVVICSVAALVAGYGVVGVLLGTAAGTVIGCLVALLVTRRCYRFRYKRSDMGQLWAVGKPWVPLTLAAVFQNNVNIVLLAILATPTSVGLFQVATRIAQLPAFFAEGFLTGWPAMEHSPISFAAKDRMGRPAYSAAVFFLFSLLTLLLLLFVSLFSGALIHIAAPSYDSAADLIPIVAAAFGANSAFRGVYRATTFPLRRYWFMLLHLVWLVPYALFAALLIPLDASYGVAVAQLASGVVVTAVFVYVDRQSPEPTPFDWKRLGVALAVALGCVVVIQLLPASALARALGSVVAMVSFPAMLLAFRVIRPYQLSTVLAIFSSLLPKRVRRSAIRHRIDQLPSNERDVVRRVIVAGRPPAEVASDLEVGADLVFARMVRGLRRLVDGGASTPVDHLIGVYVLHGGSTIERDSWANHLRSLGVDPYELHRLNESAYMVARLRRRWPMPTKEAIPR